jgi:hypothetical protein
VVIEVIIDVAKRAAREKYSLSRPQKILSAERTTALAISTGQEEQ